MKSYKRNRIVFSIFELIIGIILLVWPGTSLTIMCQCIGAFLAIGGVVNLVMFIRDHDSALKGVQFALGIIMVFIGVLIFQNPGGLVGLIPTAIGILVVISGIANLGETIALTRQSYGRWWMSLLGALLTIVFGAILITRAFGISAMITRVVGAFVVYDAVSNLLIIRNVSTIIKDAKQDSEAIDVEGEYVDDDQHN